MVLCKLVSTEHKTSLSFSNSLFRHTLREQCLTLLFISIDAPDPGAYTIISDFDQNLRSTLPKTNFYTFGKGATRDQMNIVYNPLDNSPRGSESKAIPGPGEYAYKNMAIGQDSRHFSFLRRTRNSQGKCTRSFLTEKARHYSVESLPKSLLQSDLILKSSILIISN